MSNIVPVFSNSGGSPESILEDFFLSGINEYAYIIRLNSNTVYAGACGVTESGVGYEYHSAMSGNTNYQSMKVVSQAGSIPADSVFYVSSWNGMKDTNPILARKNIKAVRIRWLYSARFPIYIFQAGNRLPWEIDSGFLVISAE